MKRVDFEYDVGERVVFVHARDIEGCVTALKLEACGPQYRVVWWHEGRRVEDWLLGWEIVGKGLPCYAPKCMTGYTPRCRAKMRAANKGSTGQERREADVERRMTMDATAEIREVGNAAARKLCGYLANMKAEKATIPVVLDGDEYLVTVEVVKFADGRKEGKYGTANNDKR